MKQLFTFLLCFSSIWSMAQTTADFENFNLTVGQGLNGSDGHGGFSVENAFLPNNYNAAWMSWSGWAISSMNDTITPGFTNDLSAITGGGYNGSTTYATSYVVGENILKLEGAAAGGIVKGFYITNNTYAYLSMSNGDNFAKKFGGVTGNDPDYFLLTVRKYKDGVLGEESVDFYLADFRFEDNSQDYIVSDWEYLDLTSLGDVDSLAFVFSSSDIGAGGINTPTYFCMDNFSTADYTVNVENREIPSLQVFPNPTTDFVSIEGWDFLSTMTERIEVRDLTGKVVLSQTVLANEKSIRLDVRDLPDGVYFVNWGNQAAKLFKK